MINSQLQKSLIHAIYSTSPNGIVVVDDEGIIIFHNQKFVELWQIPDALLNGLEPGTTIGLDHATVLSAALEHVKNKQAYLANVKKLYNKSVIDDLYEIELLDGRTLEHHSTVLRDKNNRSLGRVWFFRDITQHKTAGELLRKNELLWKSALDGAGDGAWDYDFRTGSNIVSSRVKEMLGFDMAAPGMDNQLNDWTERLHPDCLTETMQAFQAVLDNKTDNYAVEQQLRCEDGSYIWMLTRGKVLSRTPDGKPIRMVGTGIDLTSRKQAESELRIAATTFESHEAIMVADADANIIRVNRAFEKITGYSQEEVLGKNPRILNSGRHDVSFYAEMWQKLLSTGIWTGEIWDKHKNGNIYPTHMTTTAVKNEKGETTQYVSIFSDISERKKTEAAMTRSEAKFRALFDTTADAILMLDEKGFFDCNQAAMNMFGLRSQEELRAYHPADLSPPIQACGMDSMTLAQRYIKTAMQNGTAHFDWIHKRADSGEPFYADILLTSLTLDDKRVLQAAIRDITEQKLVNEALKQSEQRAKQALEELKLQKFALDKHSIVAVTDVQGRITYANSKFCEISGYSHEELIGQDHDILNSGHHPKGFFKDMYRTLAGGDVWHAEVCNRAKDGHLYWVDTTISPFMGDNGKPQSYISIRTDITQRMMAEERSNHLALYDALTELPNRRLLQDRLNQALATSSRSGQSGALLFLDLDHFKTLNDTLGHDVGDLLLQQVAERLTNCVREGDTIARLGGDEFVVLLEYLGENSLEAATHTETIGEKILVALNQPYQLDAHEYRNTPSVGATLFDGHQLGVDELLKQADIAMYAAKKAGRNALRFFDPKMQQAITFRVDLEHELRKALELRQFQLYYQIQVDHAGHPLGAETLIRWIHPERGIISPFHFIPMAEETGLILPIGQWVLDTACAQLKTWQQHPMTSNLLLAVNVSTKQFLQTDFVNQVTATVQRHGIDPTMLKLELTESLLVDNLNEIVATMAALGGLGIKFSLDDFGTGYSSLQYLKALPLNQLKIDQSFVRDIATDSSDKAIVLTIITMAHSLGLDVIAEGVETEDQRQFLLDNGCLHYQGYLFSKPVPIEQFEALL